MIWRILNSGRNYFYNEIYGTMPADEMSQIKGWRLGEILTVEKGSSRPFFDCGGQASGIISERSTFFTGPTLALAPRSEARVETCIPFPAGAYQYET
jgi:hypothetical protein